MIIRGDILIDIIILILVVCLLIFGSDAFIIPSMIGIILSLIYVYEKGGKENA